MGAGPSDGTQIKWSWVCVSYPLCSSGRSWELGVPLNWEVQYLGRVWVAEDVSHFPAHFNGATFSVTGSAVVSQLVSEFLSEGICLHVAVYLVCL